MKHSLKIFILAALVSVPAAVYAQGAKTALTPCPAVEQSVIAAAQERQKTKTKSNNANDRTAAISVRVLQAGCSETAPVDAGQAITFKWKPYNWVKRSYDGAQYQLRVWQLKDGQTAADGMIAENLVMEKTVGNVDFFDVDDKDFSAQSGSQPSVRGKKSKTYMWQVDARDAAGNTVGSPQRASYDLVLLKGK